MAKPRKALEDYKGERCPHCLASYDRFRGGRSTADAQADIECRIGGIDRDHGRVEDDSIYLGAGRAMDLAGAIKRDAWNLQHGIGRCVGDDSTFTGRCSIARVSLGYPDTAAIMGAIPEWIDESDRTIWAALPIGSGPCPPSLASIMLEMLDGDAGAVDAFDDLDYRRSESGIPSAY